VVALRGSTRDDDVATLRQSIRKSELKLPRLVPAERQTCQVIALDEKPLRAHYLRQTRAVVQRRRQVN
jgi:hypothetical protein